MGKIDNVPFPWITLTLMVGIVAGWGLGWHSARGLMAKDGPRFPWVKIGSTNTVTITNTITMYVLDIDITAVEGDGWTQKMVLRHQLKDSSKPFMVEEEK